MSLFREFRYDSIVLAELGSKTNCWFQNVLVGCFGAILKISTRTEIKGAIMATIMIRYSLSQESFRNILAQEETRESAVRDILAEFGFTFLNMYFSSSRASLYSPMETPCASRHSK